MQIRPLAIPGAFEFTPVAHGDDRGVFLESYRFEHVEAAVGHRFELAQANTSVSRKGVVRGIHFADVPPSQAKYVMCLGGAVLDFVVDIRVDSPTFGQWDSVLLDGRDHRAVYISEGLGHAFIALTDGAIVNYLVSVVFNVEREHGITPLDEEIGLVFPPEAGEPLLSPKDLAAPTLAELKAANALPRLADVERFHAARSAY